MGEGQYVDEVALDEADETCIEKNVLVLLFLGWMRPADIVTFGDSVVNVLMSRVLGFTVWQACAGNGCESFRGHSATDELLVQLFGFPFGDAKQHVKDETQHVADVHCPEDESHHVLDENDATKIPDEFVASKTVEIQALTACIENAGIETTTKQIGDLGLQIVQMKDGLSDAE